MKILDLTPRFLQIQHEQTEQNFIFSTDKSIKNTEIRLEEKRFSSKIFDFHFMCQKMLP